jgi:hypothetical protein
MSGSVCVLSASGRKIGYQSYRAAKASVERGDASQVSDRCIRMSPQSDGVNWRIRKSGKYGPLVMQADHLAFQEEGQ